MEVELATTSEEHISGLMYRDKLEENRGMLFVYPRKRILSFWMKDYPHSPFSASLYQGGWPDYTDIDSMKPYSLDTHVSKEKGRYALEMNEGMVPEYIM